MLAAWRPALHACLSLAALPHVCSADAPQPAKLPTPPVQTPAQVALMKRLAAKAEAASTAATAEVLQLFDDPGFRRGLRECCADAAELSSQELLERFRMEVKAAELPHAFQVSEGDSFFGDLTIPLAREYGVVLNQWQVALAEAKNGSAVETILDLAEVGIFGCAPFAKHAKPTWVEAADRMVYTAHNIRQLDSGSLPEFGNVTAVFSNSYVKDMVAIVPLDTGIWEFSCDAKINFTTFAKNLSGHYDCGNWDLSVATMEHFDHIILPNLRLFATPEGKTVVEEALRLFRRSPFAGQYKTLPLLSLENAAHYYEANLLGNPRFREGVKFLIGDFIGLFGSERTMQLHELALEFELPVIWSFGVGRKLPTQGRPPRNWTFPSNRRLLDPVMLSAGSWVNATQKPEAAKAFLAVFREVAEARRKGPIDDDRWGAWWAILSASLTRVAPLTAFACSSADVCVGTEVSTGDCICRVPKAQPIVV